MSKKTVCTNIAQIQYYYSFFKDLLIHLIYVQIRLKDNERIKVRKGDVPGFANRLDNSVIGHHFEAVPLLYAENGLTAKLGDNITFDSLLFPYKFAYALTYVEGIGDSVQELSGQDKHFCQIWQI